MYTDIGVEHYVHYAWRCAVLGVLCALIFLATPVHAAVVRGGETYVLDTGAMVEGDLYFLGKTLTHSGTTTGDLLSGSAQASSSGVVMGDIFSVGGRVTVGGVVRGDVRVAGGEVTIAGEVFEDVVVLGGTVLISEEAHIHGDLLVYGDRVQILGVVDGVGEVHVRMAEVEGVVGHTATFFVRESLAIRDDARVGGDLVYTAPRQAFISDTAQVAGEVAYTPREEGTAPSAIDGMRIMFGMCVYSFAAFLLSWLFPRVTRRAVETALRTDGAWYALKGLVLFLGIPVGAVLACFTIIGIIPGIMVLFAYGATITVSFGLAGVLAGAILAQWFGRVHERLRPAWASLGGIALGAISVLPLIGFFVHALLILLAFGTVLILAYEHIWRTRKETTTYGTIQEKTHEGAQSSATV